MPTLVDQTPAIASKALTWFRYDVHAQASSCELLSLTARGLDRALFEDAWLADDGSCTVEVERLHARCEKEGLDAGKLGRELVKSKRWELSEDRKTMTCLWLVDARRTGAKSIEQCRTAGKNSAKSRAAKAAKKRATQADRTTVERPLNDRSPRVSFLEPSASFPLAETHGNVFPDNDLNDRSTAVEHKTVDRSSSFSSRTNELLRSSSDVADDATSPAACHAGGAAALVAEHHTPPPLPELGPYGEALLRNAERSLVESPPAPQWLDAPGDVWAVAHALDGGGTGLDVQALLLRQLAAHQRTPGDDRHRPFLEEVRALLAGADGRAGLVDPVDAPRLVSLALHAANVLLQAWERVDPLVLRSIAHTLPAALAKQPDGADSRRVAALIACEFTRNKRTTRGCILACDQLVTPERLNGFRTKQAVLA